MRHFEDFYIGREFRIGEVKFTESNIKEFASIWDPQPFHTDNEAAQNSIYGGLIASGMHTVMAVMRNFISEIVLASNCMGSPGIQGVRFHTPVYPGDVVATQSRVESAKKLDSRPGIGAVEFSWNSQVEDRTVVTAAFTLLFAMRPHVNSGVGES